MAPSGLWGMKWSGLPAFGERPKSRHLYFITERSELERVGGLMIGVAQRASIFRHRSGCGDDGCLAGRFYWSFIPYIPLIADFIAG